MTILPTNTPATRAIASIRKRPPVPEHIRKRSGHRMQDVIVDESPERTEYPIEEPADSSKHTGKGTERALLSSLELRPREDLPGLMSRG